MTVRQTIGGFSEREKNAVLLESKRVYGTKTNKGLGEMPFLAKKRLQHRKPAFEWEQEEQDSLGAK